MSLCSCQHCIEIRLYRDSDTTRQNEPEYVQDSKISQETKGLVEQNHKSSISNLDVETPETEVLKPL